MAPRQGDFNVDISRRVRTGDVLQRAWRKVKSNGLNSDSEKTVTETKHFDAFSRTRLDKIRGQLKSDKFAFAGEVGVTPPKGKGKQGVRPIVLAPVANRVVRRAILEVLQGYGDQSDTPQRRWGGIPCVREVMATRTSVGGIPERGVPHGLALIDEAVRSGHPYFARSDIKNFFTQIPVNHVSDFLRSGIEDEAFMRLFDRALATNLENEEELRERQMFKLFPNPEVGVAQGSALSALAGNIVLREFDAKMNERGIVCVRYIDDFILLGASLAKVLAAYKSARRMLTALDMDVYDLGDASALEMGKADSGNIYQGTDVLGYRISGTSRQPCVAATQKLLTKIDDVVKKSVNAMHAAAASEEYSHAEMYVQSLAKIHRVVWGWSQSFKHTTARQTFERLDRQVDARLNGLRNELDRLSSGGSSIYRRALGVCLLSDTVEGELPSTVAPATAPSLLAA
jgi:RNA-directed DNA polymerase